MWEDVVWTFRNYMGTGLVVIWFLAALIYLFLCEKRKDRRILFVYFPTVVLAFFFNPLFMRAVFVTIGGEVYFRICWILPVILVIAYAAVKIWEKLSGAAQALFAAAAAVLIVLSGKPVYENSLYSRAENIYHVPESVVQICDAITVPGIEVKAVFPQEMLLYVRQYAPRVYMPYGRNTFDEELNNFLLAMERDTVDLEELAPYVDAKRCHYVILRETQEILQDPEDYGWELFGQTDGYIIYRNQKVPFAL
ncbi:MAG: hypothetical protein NC541_06300 [bacterium]|nr:hypothetical protein [bacterium]